MPDSVLLMRLNGVRFQDRFKRNRRQNIFNELDSFIDDEYLQKIPQPRSRPAPVVPVVEQGKQAQPNNNNLVSLESAPEPNNNQISGLLRSFRSKLGKLGKGKRQTKFRDKKRSLKSKAEKGKPRGPAVEVGLGKRKSTTKLKKPKSVVKFPGKGNRLGGLGRLDEEDKEFIRRKRSQI